MTMLYSSDGFDYKGVEWRSDWNAFVLEEDPDVVLDLDLEFDDFCANFDSLFRDAMGFVVVGEVRSWDGTYAGGKVFTDVRDAQDFLRRFTEGYRSDYEIRVDDENGKLKVTTIDHDGGMTMYVRELTERGLRYYENHVYDMSDRELHKKLMETRGLSKDVLAANRVWGTPLRSKSKKTKFSLRGKKPIKSRSGKDDRIRPSNVHEWAKKNMAKDEVDTYRSDLYVKVTPVSTKMIETKWDTKYSRPKQFTSQIDGERWFEFPMCAIGEYVEKRRKGEF